MVVILLCTGAVLFSLGVIAEYLGVRGEHGDGQARST